MLTTLALLYVAAFVVAIPIRRHALHRAPGERGERPRSSERRPQRVPPVNPAAFSSEERARLSEPYVPNRNLGLAAYATLAAEASWATVRLIEEPSATLSETAALQVFQGMILGYALAELSMTFVHVLFDKLVPIDTGFERLERGGVFGRKLNAFLMASAREAHGHHIDPQNYARVSREELTRKGVCLQAGLGLLLLATPPAFWLALMITVRAASAFGEIGHVWLHAPQVRPRFMKRLDRLGLTITVAEHARHHTPPFAADRSVLPGLTGLLWRGIEPFVDRAIYRGTGTLAPEWVMAPTLMPSDVLSDLVHDPRKIPLDLRISLERGIAAPPDLWAAYERAMSAGDAGAVAGPA